MSDSALSLHAPGAEQALADTCVAQGIEATWNPQDTIRAVQDPKEDAWSWPVSAAEASTMTQDPEDSSGNLVLLEPLARGGMGWIRRAHQRDLDREVVVKTLLPDQRGRAVSRALLREARLAGRLEHPNIVPVHGLLWRPDLGPMMVMKRVEGTAWLELLKDPEHPGWGARPADPLERNLQVLLDLCQAVHFAHSKGVLHLDIKPSNVMIGEFGEVTLLDWGIARELDNHRPRRVTGTPAYMAPEMTRPAGVLTRRTDVFLLGATLHRVISGRPRNGGDAVLEVMVRAHSARPSRYGPEVPAELAAICNKACHRDPSRRHSDAMALHRAILRFIRHRGAVQLAESANRALIQLQLALAEPLEDPSEQTLRVHRHYSAARFGFEQALKEWSESPQALAGLRACLLSMCRYAALAEDVATATALLAELEKPPSALAAEVEQARSAGEQRVQAQLALARIKADERVHGRDWRRSAVTLLNGGLTTVALLVAASGVRASDYEVSQEGNLLFALAYSVVIALAMVPFRGALLDNRAYGRFMLALVLVGPLLVLNRVVSGALELSFVHILATDCLIACAVACTLAAMLDRAFWVTAAIAVVGTLLAMTQLHWALEILAGAYLLNSVYLAWVVRPRAEG